MHCNSNELTRVENVVPMRPDLHDLWLENSFSVDIDVSHFKFPARYGLHSTA